MSAASLQEPEAVLPELDARDWNTKHACEDGASEAEPVGMIDYNCRIAIRELVALYGFETAREHVAFFLADEAGVEATKWLR